jgi:electron transfer flavoprotein beta subunit
MKIIVCLKEVIDSRLGLDYGLENWPVFQKGLPRRLNPNDTLSLAMSLGLKQADTASPVEITLISIGPERMEGYLRQGLAMGVDRAVRIWEEYLAELPSYQKSKLLSRAISLLGADLVFTGAGSLDTRDCQAGPLIASWLGLPCVSQVIGLELAEEPGSVNLVKDNGRGERERVACSLPAVITVKGEGSLPYASLDRLLESQSRDISVLTLSDLGISFAELKDDPTRVTGLLYPRPRPRKIATPDSSLPAFYRILKLLEGGVSHRRGLMLEGSRQELADQLFQLLLDEGVIKPAAD